MIDQSLLVCSTQKLAAEVPVNQKKEEQGLMRRKIISALLCIIVLGSNFITVAFADAYTDAISDILSRYESGKELLIN